MTSNTREKEAFSRRLRQALAASGGDDRSPTRLVREFNRHHKGAAVTVHAARKWLLGEAIPAQDKIKTLASWLGVTPEWLRFGETDEPASRLAAKEPAPTESDMELVRQFRLLNTSNRQVARDLLLSLLRVQRER